jgi:hypothetical protein
VSVMPLSADLISSGGDDREVPGADVSRRSNRCSYSITSSAVESSVGGISSPSVLAVLRLMTI